MDRFFLFSIYFFNLDMLIVTLVAEVTLNWVTMAYISTQNLGRASFKFRRLGGTSPTSNSFCIYLVVGWGIKSVIDMLANCFCDLFDD